MRRIAVHFWNGLDRHLALRASVTLNRSNSGVPGTASGPEDRDAFRLSCSAMNRTELL
jgi:hypothetical protein